MYIRVDINSESFTKHNPAQEDFYDEDIGFSETIHSVTLDGVELHFVEPSFLNFGALDAINEIEQIKIENLLKKNDIPYTLHNEYC